MKEKKNIERLFQEKFKNFEVQPPKDAWKNISDKLPNKKEAKKILPLWIKLSGTVAVLMLGFLLMKDNFSDSQTTITNQEKHQQDSTEKIPLNHTEAESSENKNEAITLNSNKDDVNNKINIHNTTNNNDTYVQIKQNTNTQNNSSTNVSGLTKKQKTIVEKTVKNQTEQEQVTINTDKKNIQKPSDVHSDIVISDKNNSEKSDKKFDFNTQTTIVNNNSDRQLFNKNIDININNDSIDAIANKETNELQKLLEEMNTNKEEEENKETGLQNRWRVTPNIAPVTMYSLTEGSSISNSFTDNSKENQTTLSYGLGFSYAVNKKLNIRAGVNKVSLGYNTNDVAIYATTDMKDMLANAVNINFNNTSENIVVKPETTFMNQSEFGPSTGKINQQIGFIEVPVELSYKILESRFGIEIIGGMSTLFLNENEVSVISNGMSTVLGQANNLNDVHFSTNLGVGFKYEIFKSFEASLEPMFKYQMGTFNKNDGNFKPYILGLYTGISFKF